MKRMQTPCFQQCASPEKAKLRREKSKSFSSTDRMLSRGEKIWTVVKGRHVTLLNPHKPSPIEGAVPE